MNINQEIVEQLEQVRQDGRTNMLDRRGVQVVANQLSLYKLFVWCEDVAKNPEVYMAHLMEIGKEREVTV